VKLVGAEPVIVSDELGGRLPHHGRRHLAKVTPKTKAIILNSPSNPTGALIEEDVVAAIRAGSGEARIWTIVDLCYEQLIYEDVPHNLPEGAVRSQPRADGAVRSASKSYAMTGWRAGLDDCAQGADLGLQHHPGAVHVEHPSITQKAVLCRRQRVAGRGDAMLDEYRSGATTSTRG
jgi:aspartate/methionine/tyrosine aminotransferase